MFRITLKRKDETIGKLKRKDAGCEIDELRKKHSCEIKRVNRRCRTLEKKAEIASTSFDELTTEADVAHAQSKDEMNEKDNVISYLEDANQSLQTRVEASESDTASLIAAIFQSDSRTYSVPTRLMVYDLVMNQVPTHNIPSVLDQVIKRTGAKLDRIPHRNTVEMMVRKMGVITELQTAEELMRNSNSTIGFDATTQEGVHVHSVHLTFKTGCLVVAIDQIPGGTAHDYSQHICESVDHLAEVYSQFNHIAFQECREALIQNISNTMSDRVASNHAAIRLISESWKKELNELNCHLHPLDTVASSARGALKSAETSKGKLWGNDCFVANIVLAMNKLRFKDGKGDPMGFKSFLSEQLLGKGFIPRYRGNHLHVIFHICGKYFAHHDAFLTYLSSGLTLGGLRAALLQVRGRYSFRLRPLVKCIILMVYELSNVCCKPSRTSLLLRWVFFLPRMISSAMLLTPKSMPFSESCSNSHAMSPCSRRW